MNINVLILILASMVLFFSGCVSNNSKALQTDHSIKNLPGYPILKRSPTNSSDSTVIDIGSQSDETKSSVRFVKMEVTTHIPKGSPAKPTSPPTPSPACDAELVNQGESGTLILGTKLPFQNLGVPTEVSFNHYIAIPLKSFNGHFFDDTRSPDLKDHYWGYDADTEHYYEVKIFANGKAMLTQFEIDMTTRVLRHAKIKVLDGPENKAIDDRAVIAEMSCTPVWM